ncbi:MAG: DUF4238 domain-containing protein [Planctomycetes bacterium]|nr:DUF4238 domain-containing protein [Planctomycetota bacterium]
MAPQKQKTNQRTKKGHYVAQFYLRGFTNESGMMYCYDKVSGKSHTTSTLAAAQEPYFYECPPSDDPLSKAPLNTIENAISRIETVMAPLVVKLIQDADAGTITAGQLLELSPFVVIQWLRTKTNRDICFEMFKKWGQANVDDLLRVNFPEQVGKLNFTVDKKKLPIVHAYQIFDQEAVRRMANAWDRHIWVIGINETDRLFYSSDHPVVRRANCEDHVRKLYGADDPGIEFLYPLDSRHILLIMERTHFAEWKKHDNRTVKLKPEQIRDYNGVQVRRSCQRIYCANDDFDLAREVCAAEPAIRNPDRARVFVESLPIENMKNHVMVTALE